jgi:hypothetical protein
MDDNPLHDSIRNSGVSQYYLFGTTGQVLTLPIIQYIRALRHYV